MTLNNFNNRLNNAVEWEDIVKNRFEKMGFLTNKYGQGVQLSSDFRDSIRYMNDNETCQLIRYLPDLVISIKNKRCYLVEIKSEKRTDTLNYSYELASYDVGMRLYSIGVDVIVVFSGWRSDFIQNLKFIKKYNNKEYLNSVNGSRTPFGLIEKNSVPTFDEFFRNKQL